MELTKRRIHQRINRIHIIGAPGRNEKERNKLLLKIAKKKKWITAGIYTTWIGVLFKKADMIIWMHPPKHVRAYRVIKRYIQQERRLKYLKSMLILLRYVIMYETHEGKSKTGYQKHKEIVMKHKPKLVYIRNKKDLDDFLKTISPSQK